MILNVVGARPNFVKMAPVVTEMRRRGLPQFLLHTGQHYDAAMSAVFFEQLGMPEPDLDLGIGSGSHAVQTARIMMGFEEVCLSKRPQLVVVAGDVNSTLACALVASKLHIPLAHVEAGLRSHDRTMPEEINRVITDHVADLLFTTEPDGNRNLAFEGIAPEKVFYVGNPMIDSLRRHINAALSREPWRKFSLCPGAYGVVTLHRPSNVDDLSVATELAVALREVAATLPLVLPMHPRTTSLFSGMLRDIPGLCLVPPLGYLDFLGLQAKAHVVITDSGGVQEETTYLDVPCVTVRPSTERPVTVSQGTNVLVPPVAAEISRAVRAAGGRVGCVPELWDGKAAERIVEVLKTWYVDRL